MKCLARSSPRKRRSSALHFVFQICPSLISPNKKRLVETSRLLFVISVHFRYRLSVLVPARFVTFFLSFGKKNQGSAPSSRRRQLSTGQLHLMVQICPSLIAPNKKRPVETGRFLFVVNTQFRYHFSGTKIGHLASLFSNISFASFDTAINNINNNPNNRKNSASENFVRKAELLHNCAILLICIALRISHTL